MSARAADDNTTMILILGAVAFGLYYFFRQSLSAQVTIPGSGSGGAPVSATAPTQTTIPPATAPPTGAGVTPTQPFTPAAPSTGIGNVLESAFNQVFPMQVSPQGLALIQSEEGLNLTSYPDAGGYSIGYGHFITAADYTNFGILPEAGVTITQDVANQLLSDDLLNVENIINENVTVVLSQNQFDALADFVYNIGSGNFLSSTLLKDLNAGNYEAAAGQFVLWNKSQGQVKTGLTTRRLAETNLFQTA